MTLYYNQQGQGPDIILVHGWGMHGGIWGDLPAYLATRYRVTTLDLPGHGRSRALPGPYDLATLADVVASQVTAPATWIGWSLGGMVALSVAARHEAHVHKLVLVGATPRFVQESGWPHAMQPEVLAQFALELGADFRVTLQRFLSLQVGVDATGRALLRTLRSEMFRHGEPAASALAAGLAILRDADLRPVLARITCPVQIIQGARDRLTPLAAAEYLAAHLPHARLARVEHAGHAPFLSHPETFRKLLLDFL